ncbi:hypothetical protein CDL15_Pgr004279 [Punica granatum]|nr:hypothetical protein CDL15_Pgr004279 [Punica granatum]
MSKAASHARNHLLVDHKPMEGNSGPATRQQLPYLSRPDAATDASNCGSEELTEVPVAGSANPPDESLKVFSHFSRKERLEHDQPFPMFGLSRNRDKSMMTHKNDQASLFCGQAAGPQIHPKIGPSASPGDFVKQEKMSLWTPSGYETRSQERLLDLGGTSRHFDEKNSLVVSASSKDDFFTFSCGYPVGPSAGRLEKVTAKGRLMNTSLTKLGPDQCNYHGSSAVFVQQSDNDPLTSKDQLAFYLGNNVYRKSLKDLGTSFFQSQTSPFEVAEAECSSRSRRSFFDIETMRICTTIDSVEGSKFHQKMKELFFTEKKTDANLLKGGKILRESVSSTTQFKGNTNKFSEVLRLSRGGGQQGVKLQPLWSSTDSEEKDNADDLKNESSAETDTMDMDALKDDHLCGEGVSLSNKNCVAFPKLLASRAAAESMNEEGRSRENADIPPLDLNYLALPSATSSSTDDKEPSMSKTQSLDAAHLLPTADGHMNQSKSTESASDPGIRWVKRLKLSNSETLFARGTKILKMEEGTSSPEKFNPFLGKTMKRRMTSSEPLTSEKSYKKKPILSDRNDHSVMKGCGSCSTSQSLEKSRSELLSNTWIRRWCRVQKTKKHEGEEAAFVFCEPQSLKASLDEIRKKQFPSLAAMALMGKAMHGFRPCEFKKSGSFVVWNTRGC